MKTTKPDFSNGANLKEITPQIQGKTPRLRPITGVLTACFQIQKSPQTTRVAGFFDNLLRCSKKAAGKD
ncbi:hypothetical protein [Marinobacterium zhoushanense]|uniref:hypothetical protein n=1 Tax=Marinobacterium zhoushanense TaxID=1679163 RepID=UPI001665F5A2|nr:hypothetical protein [Marinobacterium zhoushanense]